MHALGRDGAEARGAKSTAVIARVLGNLRHASLIKSGSRVMDASLCRIVVFVSNVDVCVTWYTEHFGFALVQATRIAREWCEVEVAPGVNASCSVTHIAVWIP